MAHDLDIEQQIHRGIGPVPTHETLFTTFSDRVLMRADDVLNDRNVFGPAPVDAKRLLRLVWGRGAGAARAISRLDLTTRLGLSDRAVRDLVHELRSTYGVQIGAARAEDGGGYYLMNDEADCLRVSDSMIAQGLETIRAGVNIRGPRRNIGEVMQKIGAALHEADPVKKGARV